MKRFYLCTVGYYNHPSFTTRAEAQAALKDSVAAAVAACKRRFGTAHKHKEGRDNYRITATRDRQSALWTVIWISER